MNSPAAHAAGDEELYVGLMSGSSLDGIDVVLADLAHGRVRLLAHRHREFAPELRAALSALQSTGEDELHRAAVASQHLGRAYAQAITDLLQHAGRDSGEIIAAGVHGQTVRHRPEAGYTIQLNAPALVAELAGVDVVADFRSRDIAAGGQGAPLVPGFHAAVFRAASPRAVVNIGGISNLTGVPAASSSEPVIGFDCGPGNVLIDLWASRHLGRDLDEDGAWAAQGSIDAGLLQVLLAEPYFALAPPKSTGRDLFNGPWLDRRLLAADPAGKLAPRDVQATLTELTATCIARSLARWWPDAKDVVVCGGGVFNGCLMRMLQRQCAPLPVISSAQFGIAPEHVEALAFAWLARENLQGRPASLPAVTGARAARPLGARYPK
jgi:anhydro-N-acetylmuramic acid kinase